MPLKTHLDDEPTLNLTAMLDVLFLLIIFFMLGTRFVDAERNIKLNVPQVVDKGALASTPTRFTVNVYPDGRIILDQEPVSLEQLTARLTVARRQHGEPSVLVRGDGNDKYQRMVTVLNACKQAGIKNLGISVRTVPANN